MEDTTVIALFKDRRDAEAAVRALQSADFDSARVEVAPRGHALYYMREIEAGRTLVTVESEPDRTEKARRILRQEGAFEAAPLDRPHLKKAS